MTNGAVLDAQDIWKRYRRGGPDILRGIDLSVRYGELVSVTGENGSGKSTLLAILAGEKVPTRGSVKRRGRPGYCPQAPAVYPRLTVDEHFALYASAARLDPNLVRSVRDVVLDLLKFAQFRDTQARALSGGSRAKLNLALSMLGDPDVLILDEPYAAFDLASHQAFWSLMERQRDEGKAVVVVAHMEPDPERFDQCLTLQGGVLHEAV